MAQSMRPFLKMLLLYITGRVGMAECSLDLIVFKLETDHFFSGWGWGAGADFFQQLKLDFL